MKKPYTKRIIFRGHITLDLDLISKWKKRNDDFGIVKEFKWSMLYYSK